MLANPVVMSSMFGIPLENAVRGYKIKQQETPVVLKSKCCEDVQGITCCEL